jgi:Spy/CpxP family protein refolding chaperone
VNISALGTIIYNKILPAREASSATISTHKPDSLYNCTEAECPMATELGLTHPQMEQMRAQQTQINRNILGLSREVAELRTALIQELMESKPDTTKMNQQLKIVDSLQTTIQHITIQNLLEVKKVLNREQQEILFNQILRECGNGKNRALHHTDATSTLQERN